jgi:hypothetical protein
MLYPLLIMSKICPSFRGITLLMHSNTNQFLKVCDNEGVEHEDVEMKMFVSSLEGEARSWYKSLQDNTIAILTPFFNKLLERWGNKQDTSFPLRNFIDLTEKENETILEFNTRFGKAYHKIPNTVIPNDEFDLIAYLEKSDGILGVLIRKKDPTTLDVAHKESITTKKHLSLSSKVQVPLNMFHDPYI